MFTILFTIFTILTTLALKFCLLLGCQKTLKISRIQIPEKMKNFYKYKKITVKFEITVSIMVNVQVTTGEC